MLDTYRMVVTAFSMINKANQIRFFKETFLVANISPEIITLSGADVYFSVQEL